MRLCSFYRVYSTDGIVFTSVTSPCFPVCSLSSTFVLPPQQIYARSSAISPSNSHIVIHEIPTHRPSCPPEQKILNASCEKVPNILFSRKKNYKKIFL